ncbi:hypothetical protein D3C81_1512850 [compost metagenome]
MPARNSRTICSVLARFCLAPRARMLASWMEGPSAIGSVKGMPSSITSAPASGRPLRIAREAS